MSFYSLAFANSSKNRSSHEAQALVEHLSAIRNHVITLEQSLLDGEQTRTNSQTQIRKIKELLKLQKQEKALGQKRLSELEHTVAELEIRQTTLQRKLKTQQKSTRKFLMTVEAAQRTPAAWVTVHLPDNEKVEAPRRRVLTNLVDRGLKEIEVLRADLFDAVQLESRIQEEKQQLSYLFQDLREQESVLELNRQLQMDFLRKSQNERVSRLESYRKLKNAEAQVEHLIGEFNARKELEHAVETERLVSKAMMQGEFGKLKGKLPLPLPNATVLTGFGRSFDSKSGLYIFKKGIDISAPKSKPVQAIFSGRVAFSGILPNYGQVVIIDHGDHFYSLCAHLGVISKKANESVVTGEPIGLTSETGTPLYFEIRARNVAVNPLQWVVN